MEGVPLSVEGGLIMGRRRIGRHFQHKVEVMRAVKYGIFRGMRSSKHGMALDFRKVERFRRMAPKAAIADQSKPEVTKNLTL